MRYSPARPTATLTAAFKNGDLISLHVYLCFIPTSPSPLALPFSLPSQETKQADSSNKQWREALQ